MSERDHLYDRKRMLVDAARAERDPFAGARRVGALAAALTGATAPGCVTDDESLGAYGGSPDIPPGLLEMQQWAGSLQETTPTRPGKNMVRISLPENYARDWTVQLGAAGVPSGASVAVASTQAAEVQLRWGHHGAQETIVMDYPARGASFTVHGSYVEVAVFDPGTPVGTPTATYQVWVNEGASARSSPDAFQPVRTVQLGSIAIAGAALAIAPPRARAFYVTGITNNGAAPFELRLQDNLVTRAFYEVEGAGAGSSFPRLADLIKAPWLLTPQSNAVLVTNTTGFIMDAVSVHFLLDLGS